MVDRRALLTAGGVVGLAVLFWLAYGTGPIGTTNHILGEALRIAAGIDLGHVPYKGGGPAIQDLVPGRIPLVANVVLEALPYIRSGKARAIAVTGPKRVASLPDVPTVGESVPNYVAGTSFWVLLARAGTPDSLMGQLHAGAFKAMPLCRAASRVDAFERPAIEQRPRERRFLQHAEGRRRRFRRDSARRFVAAASNLPRS